MLRLFVFIATCFMTEFAHSQEREHTINFSYNVPQLTTFPLGLLRTDQSPGIWHTDEHVINFGIETRRKTHYTSLVMELGSHSLQRLSHTYHDKSKQANIRFGIGAILYKLLRRSWSKQ